MLKTFAELRLLYEAFAEKIHGETVTFWHSRIRLDCIYTSWSVYLQINVAESVAGEEFSWLVG